MVGPEWPSERKLFYVVGMFELDRVLSSMVGGMQSSVDGQEDLRKGLQGMSAILEKEAAKANGDIRDITG